MRAQASLAAASTLLHGTGDTVHSSFVDLLHAQAVRVATSDDADRVEEFERCISRLKILASTGSPLANNLRYHARAQFQLGLALIAKGRFDEAEAVARALHDAKSTDRRWKLRSDILLVRVARMRAEAQGAPPDSARVGITQILRRLDGRSDPRSPEIEALGDLRGIETSAQMEAAQICMIEREWSKAREHLGQAIKLAEQSPLDWGVCHLHKARSYSSEGRQVDAERELRVWDSVKEGIEHSYALRLAKEVADHVARCDPSFRVKSGQDKYDYGDIQKSLQRWLLAEVESMHGEDGLMDKGPAMLGVHENTITAWRKALGSFTDLRKTKRSPRRR